MGTLSRDDILQADDLETVDVEVPEWGGTVRVKALTGTQRDAFEASIVQMGSNGHRQFKLANMRARFVALCAVDEQGQRLFPSDDDVKALGRKSAAALERVWDAGRKLSRLSDDDVEELVEGFDDGPSEPSTSG